jgi:hypothetical protein
MLLLLSKLLQPATSFRTQSSIVIANHPLPIHSSQCGDGLIIIQRPARDDAAAQAVPAATNPHSSVPPALARSAAANSPRTA